MSTLTAPNPDTLDTTVSTPIELFDQAAPKRPYTTEDRDIIIAMAVLGYRQREVAERLGRTTNSLAVYCHYQRISFKRLREQGRLLRLDV